MVPPPPPAAPVPPPPAQPAPRSARPGGFNPASVNPMDWGILATGFLAFIFSFVDYYDYSQGPFSKNESAWDGFFGWFSMLLALLSAVLLAVHILAPHVDLPVPARMTVLGGFALATLLVILAGFIDSRSYPSVVDKTRGPGYFLSLIVILAGLVLSFLRLRETGGKMPWEKRTA